MSEPFVGQIALFPYNFAPRGWAFCTGQILPISQYSALFSLLGTMYGGNGKTTFQLPDLQGRVPIGVGQGPGLSDYVQGEIGGVESVTLLPNQNAVHNHPFNASGNDATTSVASGNMLAKGEVGSAHTGFTVADIYSKNQPTMSFASNALSSVGGNGPHNNLQPFQVLSYCIALEGIFPSRP